MAKAEKDSQKDSGNPPLADLYLFHIPPLVGGVMITVLLFSYSYEKLLIDIVLRKISTKVLTNLRIIMNIVCFYLYFEVFIAECWQKIAKSPPITPSLAVS